MNQPPKRGSMRARAMALESGGNVVPLRPGASVPPAPRRTPYDPAKAPAGYDSDYWGMAVLFRDLAMKDDINLRAGVPVIYGELRRMFEWFDLEHGSRAFQKRGDGEVELTYADMYRDGDGKVLSWVAVGYAIIEEFWSRVWDDDALVYFCDMDILMSMAQRVCERWQASRFRASRIREPEPEIMTWNREGHRRRRTPGE